MFFLLSDLSSGHDEEGPCCRGGKEGISSRSVFFIKNQPGRKTCVTCICEIGVGFVFVFCQIWKGMVGWSSAVLYDPFLVLEWATVWDCLLGGGLLSDVALCQWCRWHLWKGVFSISWFGRGVFSMILVIFFSSNQCERAVKNTMCRENTMLDKCDPDPDEHENARIRPMANVLGKTWHRDTNFKGSIHLFLFYFLFGINLVLEF